MTNRSRVITALIAVVITAAIPVYGLLSGHWAEMMGGRMLVWGLAFYLIVVIDIAVFGAMGLRMLLRYVRQKDS